MLGTVLQISPGESDAKNRASTPPIKPKPRPPSHLYSVLIPYQTLPAPFFANLSFLPTQQTTGKVHEVEESSWVPDRLCYTHTSKN